MNKKAKSRLIYIIMAVLFVINCLPIAAIAEELNAHTVFSIGSATGKYGDTVELDISVLGDTTISGLLLYGLSYDTSALEFVEFNSFGELVTGSIAGPDSLTGNTINLGYNPNIIPSGKICTAVFKIKDNIAEGNYSIGFSTVASSDNGKAVSSEIKNGTVEVSKWLKGDFDENGVIDMQDAVHFIGWVNFSYIPGLYSMPYSGNKDFNHDGEINMQDAVYLIGWINFSYIPGLYDIDWYDGNNCEHSMQHILAKTPSCTDDGNIEYWYCPKCNKYFSDEAGTSEIPLEDTIIQASGHTYSDVWSCDNDCHWHDPNCVHKDDENIELKDLSEHTYIDHKCSVCSHIEEFVVTFYDYDDTVLDIQMVAYGNSANDPEIPEHSGLGFDKWEQSFSYITGDTDVKAKYNHYYTVKFIDYDGSVLKTESVLEGHSATEPEIPKRMGYTFNGWDKPFSNIVENTVVTAIYLQNKCTVQFVMPDGSSIEKRENITYGSSLEEPANSDVFSEYYFDFTNHTYNEFSGWNKSLKNVTFDNNGDTLTFEAQYNIPYNQPVIALEIKNNDCLQASIYMPKSCYVYGIDFGFNWSDDIGITSYNLNENACPLYNPPQEEKGHPDEDVSVIYNNKTKSFEYIWMCGNGHTVTKAESTYIVLIEEIDFAISGDAKLNQEVISVLDSCSIFYSDHGHCTFEDLIQINPIVVVK